MALSQKRNTRKPNTLPARIAVTAFVCAGLASVVSMSDGVSSAVSEVLATQGPSDQAGIALYTNWNLMSNEAAKICADNEAGVPNLGDLVERKDAFLNEIADPMGVEVATRTICNTERGELAVNNLELTVGPFYYPSTCRFDIVDPGDRSLMHGDTVLWACSAPFRGEKTFKTSLVTPLVVASETASH